MKFVISLILVIYFTLINAFAIIYPNATIRDSDGHIMGFDSDGKITVKLNGGYSAPTGSKIYTNKTIRDTDGHQLKPNADGSLNLKGE